MITTNLTMTCCRWSFPVLFRAGQAIKPISNVSEITFPVINPGNKTRWASFLAVSVMHRRKHDVEFYSRSPHTAVRLFTSDFAGKVPQLFSYGKDIRWISLRNRPRFRANFAPPSSAIWRSEIPAVIPPSVKLTIYRRLRTSITEKIAKLAYLWRRHIFGGFIWANGGFECAEQLCAHL